MDKKLVVVNIALGLGLVLIGVCIGFSFGYNLGPATKVIVEYSYDK